MVVFPSLLPEGFGRPIIEGMASGIPVVASNTGPSKEILGKNSGIIVPPNDPSKMTKALKFMIDDSSVRKKNGAIWIKTNF